MILNKNEYNRGNNIDKVQVHGKRPGAHFGSSSFVVTRKSHFLFIELYWVGSSRQPKNTLWQIYRIIEFKGFVWVYKQSIDESSFFIFPVYYNCVIWCDFSFSYLQPIIQPLPHQTHPDTVT